MNKKSIFSDLDSEKFYFKALFYGDLNTGKTHLAGTAQDHSELSPVVIIRAEEGTFTVRGKGIRVTERIKTLKDFDAVFWTLVNDDTIKTVVLDSGTSLAQVILEEIVSDNVRKSSKGKDPNRVTIRDWGDLNFVLRSRVRNLFDLPKHVIVTALQRLDYDTEIAEERIKRGPVRGLPDFSPRLSNSIMACADFVWRLAVAPCTGDKDETRILYTRTHKIKGCVYAGKTRGSNFHKELPKTIKGDNLTMSKIWTLIKNAQLNSSTHAKD